MCDHVLSAPPILFPPVLLGSSLNPMAVPFPSESLLDPTADFFHPPPSASIDMPPPRPVSTPLASPNIPLVAPSPEYQHNELSSSPVQHDELAPPGIQHDELDVPSTVPLQPNVGDPPVIPHDELDDLIQASVDQFLSSEDWSHFVESA